MEIIYYLMLHRISPSAAGESKCSWVIEVYWGGGGLNKTDGDLTQYGTRDRLVLDVEYTTLHYVALRSMVLIFVLVG